MTFTFRPASSFTERAGIFVSLTGGTNSGKTWSALALGRGIAGPQGKLAVLDTEGGRTLHLKDQFRFDIDLMSAPYHPQRFSDAAKAAEDAGYDALVIDSFTAEWAGIGGVLEMKEDEVSRVGAKGPVWVKPKRAHDSMVYSLLQRRIPIIFSIRGKDTFVPPDKTIFKAITSQTFPFEVTVSFRLAAEAKGYIDLSDPKANKMEGPHRAIFKHGDRISEEHGAQLAAWARGSTPAAASAAIPDEVVDMTFRGDEAAREGMVALGSFWSGLTPAEKKLVGGAEKIAAWKAIAQQEAA